MKAFIGFIVTFVALVCVKCDSEAEQKAWFQKTLTEYMKLSEDQMKLRANTNVKAIEAMLKEAADQYVKQDLALVAQHFNAIIKFLDTEVPKAFEALKKVEDKNRKQYTALLAISVEMIKTSAEKEKTKRKTNPLKVTDTEDNYSKQLRDVCAKILVLYKGVIENEKKDKEKAFWADFHQKIYDFLAEGFKNIDSDLKKVKTSSIRSKNMLELSSDFTVLLDTITIAFKLASSHN